MKNFEEKVFNLMESKTLVFQSQATADSWAMAYAFKYGSVFKDSTVSWDSFRDMCTEYPKECMQAEDIDRRMFVDLFAKKPLFEKLKYYADSRFLESKEAYKRSIAEDLPKLCKAFDKDGQIKKDLYSKASEDLINDLKIIVPEYRKFLNEFGLYEKNLYSPDFSGKNDFILVLPGNFKDFEVETAMQYCETIEPEISEDLFKNLEIYKNSTAEIRSVLRRVRELLDNGTNPKDIAITCCDLKKCRPYIEYESHIRDIEPQFIESRKLSELPPGKFLIDFIEARKENWKFLSVKKLVLNTMIPWKTEDRYSLIITNAIKLKINKGLKCWHDKLYKNKCDEKWPNTEQDNINNSLTFETFERFENAIKTFDSTVKSDNLRECFMTLSKALLENLEWTSEEDSETPKGLYAKVFGSCMDELAKLEERAQKYKINDVNELLTIFEEVLDTVAYLENPKTLGLKIYNFPLSSGLTIKHHFVINLSDNLTRISRDPYPFLDRDAFERKDLGKDIMGTYLSLDSKLSMSTDSYSGPSVIPTVFVEESRHIAGIIREDSFEEEKKLWDTDSNKITMTQNQKNGFEHMQNAGALYSDSMELSSPELPLKLNVSGVKDIEKCPYKTYAGSVLGLKETQYSMSMENYAEIGNILHTVIQRAVKEAGKTKNLKAKRLKEIFAEELYVKYGASKEAPPAKIFLDRIYKQYDEVLKCFAENNYLNEGQFEFLAMENDTAYSIVLGNIELKGRADLVLENSDKELAVIDMKRNARDYYSKSDLNKTSLQLMLYSILLKENKKFGKVPVYGAYYSFAEGKFREVWPQKPLEEVLANMDERLGIINKTVGDIAFFPKFDANECRTCFYKTLCRGGYEIK